MSSPKFDDLHVFLCVAREGSFTRAANKLGVSQSALSQTVRALEERLQIRLLTRTTRSVSPTAAGERLLATLAPNLDGIAAELDLLREQRDKPAGLVRITCSDNVLRFLVLPKLAPILREYPDIQLEFDINNGFRNIVADRFDAGIRLGEAIDRDMIAVPIEPPVRMCAVATPDYLARFGVPQHPRDLLQHRCINLRMQSAGGLAVPFTVSRRARRQGLHVQARLRPDGRLRPLTACAAPCWRRFRAIPPEQPEHNHVATVLSFLRFRADGA